MFVTKYELGQLFKIVSVISFLLAFDDKIIVQPPNPAPVSLAPSASCD